MQIKYNNEKTGIL